jgi:hypothetical protein
MVVVLTFTAKDPTVLPAQFRLGGSLPAPAAPVKPGHNPAFPGLVVTLSTTGPALGGPTANLANLFQIVSPSLQLDGTTQVTAVWTNSQVDFGSDVDATITAYTVSGTAPDVLPATLANTDVNSNIIDVTFRVSAVTGATVPAPAATGPTTTTVAGATTTSVKPTTTTAKPGTTTTTARAATTTVPATTSTTKCANPLGILCP